MKKLFKRTVYILFTCLIVLLSIYPVSAQVEDEVELIIFHTTDIHGRIDNMAKVAYLIDESRGNSQNIIILDSGDTIQGNLAAFYFKGAHALKIMDVIGYDAMTLGNHDFNFGTDVLNKRSKEISFPFLCANIIEKNNSIDYVGKSIKAAKPYVIKDINGIKVAILGLTTPSIKEVEREKNIKELEFLDTIEVAKTYVPILRQKADIIIALTHQDVDVDKQIAEEVDGIDLILAGHQHKVIFETPIIINNTVIAKGSCFGQDVTKISIKLVNKDGEYKIKDISGQLIMITDDMPENPSIRDIIDDYNYKLDSYQNTEIVIVEGEFSAANRETSETSMGNLMAHMMKSITGADIAIEELWTDNALKEGVNTIKDIFDVFPYENVIMKAKLTGEQLKEVLENNANNYGTTYFCNIDGVKVIYDLTQPCGKKVVEIIYGGKPILANQEFMVATDSYLASGGFGFTTYRESSLIIDDDLWTRESFVEWLKKQEVIRVDDYKDFNNIKILYNEQLPDIIKLKDAKIFTGYPDGGFYGGKLMTKAEYIVSLARVLGVKPAEGENFEHWAYAYINPLIDDYILNKEYIYNLDEGIDSSEAIDIANKMLHKYGFDSLTTNIITEYKDNLLRADAAILISKVYDIVHLSQ